MIIDADTHITLTEKPEMTYEQLLRSMDACGIDRSIIWLSPPYLRHIRDANRYIHQAYKAHPDRFIPFGWADIHLGLEEMREEIRVCLDDYGFCGIKFNGAQNAYFIDSPIAMELAGVVAEKGKAIAYHIGADFYDYTHPYRAAKVARLYPKTPVLFSHMGGAGKPDLGPSCIEFAKELPNITLIGSNITYLRVLEAIDALGSERVCFGSDAPFLTQRVELATAMAACEELKPEDRANVLGNNIQRVLGL